MSQQFSRMITLLRNERKLTQKQVAADLGISPAVLSHYEKGIRECKLDFLVSVADYFEVSCDYLLGRTSEPGGIGAPSPAPRKEEGAALRQSHRSYATGQKKVLVGAIHILFDILSRGKSKALTTEVSRSMMLLLYSLFRILYASNSENPAGIFRLSKSHAQALSESALLLSLSHVRAELKQNRAAGEKIRLSPRTIRESYPAYASSLFAVIECAEACAELPWPEAED